MKLNKYNKVIENTPIEVRENIRFSMDILDRIHELLEVKFGGKQKLLAEKMGKSEAEISKLLSGIQNYTTKTLMKLQAAFGEPIIAVCTSSDDSTYVLVKITHCMNHAKVEVSSEGYIEETLTSYQDYKPAELARV